MDLKCIQSLQRRKLTTKCQAGVVQSNVDPVKDLQVAGVVLDY